MSMKGKKVLVRTYSAGVHYGTLESKVGKEVILTDSKRIWYWEGANSISQLAVEGTRKPENCKFSMAVPRIILTESIEIIETTKLAQDSIESLQWKE